MPRIRGCGRFSEQVTASFFIIKMYCHQATILMTETPFACVGKSIMAMLQAADSDACINTTSYAHRLLSLNENRKIKEALMTTSERYLALQKEQRGNVDVAKADL